MITAAVVALAVASGALAQEFAATPLVSKIFPNPSALPYQVDTDAGVRGHQYGFNICNSTTENQKSDCQTFWMNSPSDFCLTYPGTPGSDVASQEGEMVAWCTAKGHGTRLIPDKAITGLEWRKTPDYLQVVGFIDQSQLNLAADDFGGEMDSGGADGRGNPMGGVWFSTEYGEGNVPNWTCFIGGGQFACKACDPKGADRAHHCEHIYDRIGLAYNMPNAAEDNVFKSCEAPNAVFPGVYTQNGQVMTYTQPDEKLGAITTMPYTATVPVASNCKTFSSAQLFTGLPSGTAPPKTSKATGSSSKPTGAAATGAGKPSGSGAASAAATGSTGSGDALVVSAASSLLGVVFAALFLA